MRRVAVKEETELGELVDASRRERIVLTRRGTPVALLTALPKLDAEELRLSRDPAFAALMRARGREREKLVTLDALQAETEAELASRRAAKRRSGRKRH